MANVVVNVERGTEGGAGRGSARGEAVRVDRGEGRLSQRMRSIALSETSTADSCQRYGALRLEATVRASERPGGPMRRALTVGSGVERSARREEGGGRKRRRTSVYAF